MAGQLVVVDHELQSSTRALRVEVGPRDSFLALPFEEAIELFAARRAIPFEEALDELGRVRDDAFASRVLTSEHLLRTAQAELLRIQREGGTAADFAAAIRAGELSLGISPARAGYLRTIFETNMASAYGQGRVAQLSRPEVVEAVPYRIYTAVLDARTRPSHAALDGKAWDARETDEWRRFQGPISYNCRCTLRAETQADAAALARRVSLPADAF